MFYEADYCSPGELLENTDIILYRVAKRRLGSLMRLKEIFTDIGIAHHVL